MENSIKTKNLRIDGMTCVNCQNKIEKNLRNTTGIENVVVSYNAGTATVSYNAETINAHEISAIIEKLGFSVRIDDTPKTANSNYQAIGTLIIIIAIFMLVQNFGLLNYFNKFPLTESGMGYGMLFLIGVITSVHCLAMCGGINLSQCIPQTNINSTANKITALRPSFLYNLGRVISYTAVGVAVGSLGSVVSFSGTMRGIVQLAAGVFMVIMGINMLGIFPALRRFNLRMPKIFGRHIDHVKGQSKSPLYVGLLNGFMPCGPLQAMQLYALSTGSPLKGGLSMLLFSLGTVPLMFGLGALSSVLSKKFTKRVMTVGAMLVVILGLSMFSYGWNLSGFNFNELSRFFSPVRSAAVGSGRASAGAFEPSIVDGMQLVSSTLSGGKYPSIIVQEGIPVKWSINAPQGSINDCNGRMIVREYGIEYQFKNGENVIEFTPSKTGRFPYSCWMGMIHSSITVVAQGTAIAEETFNDSANNAPVPAGVNIPTDTAAVAQFSQDIGYQVVTINLRDSGFEPSIIVVQKDIPVNWVINNNSLDEGNNLLIVPAYLAQLEIEAGNNGIQFMPSESFDFSTGDNVYYGYVKVVDDIGSIDMDGIKNEVSGFETLIYPDTYFEASDNQGVCCDSSSVA
jgi:sulfite exporter TauE/SafE/copper chaperone CopZ